MIPEPSEVEIPSEVISAAIAGKLTIFIGNGLSRLYGYPSWSGLADAMLTALAKDKDIPLTFNDVSLMQDLPLKTKISIADSYFKSNWKLGAEKKIDLTYEHILKKYQNSEKLKEGQIFAHLAKCRVKFITTNYDDLLDSQLNKLHQKSLDGQSLEIAEDEKNSDAELEKKNDFEIISYPHDLNFSAAAKQTVLLHLHGIMGKGEGKLIASTADYLKLYTDREFRESFLKFLEGQTLVFIGYGLEELEVLEMLFRASQLDGSDKKHIILLPLMSHKLYLLEHLKKYWGELGFQVKAYNTDKRGYDSIEDLILKWAPEIAKEAKPPMPTKNNEVIDSILSKFDEVFNES